MATSTQNLKTGIAKVGYAMVTEKTDESITYGQVEWLESEISGGRSYTADANGELNEIYADSIVAFSAEQNNGYDITLELLAAIDNIREKWLDYTIDTENKAAGEFSNNQANPKFALILIDNTSGGEGETTIFTYCNVSGRPSITGSTAENSIEVQYPSYSISSRPRPTDKNVCWVIHGKEQFATLPDFVTDKKGE